MTAQQTRMKSLLLAHAVVIVALGLTNLHAQEAGEVPSPAYDPSQYRNWPCEKRIFTEFGEAGKPSKIVRYRYGRDSCVTPPDSELHGCADVSEEFRPPDPQMTGWTQYGYDDEGRVVLRRAGHDQFTPDAEAFATTRINWAGNQAVSANVDRLSLGTRDLIIYDRQGRVVYRMFDRGADGNTDSEITVVLDENEFPLFSLNQMGFHTYRYKDGRIDREESIGGNGRVLSWATFHYQCDWN